MSKSKKTDVSINIRKNRPGGYILTIYRPAEGKAVPTGIGYQEEMYFAKTIEDVERITSSLLRSGTVPKELGGA